MFWLDLTLKEKHTKRLNIKPQTHVLRDTATGEYVNSLTLSVCDEKDELFYFNGFPLDIEIGINLKT